LGGVSSRHDGDREKKLDKCLVHRTKRYKVTADQQIQIRSILKNQEQDVQFVKSDTFMSRGDRREEMTSAFETSQKKIAGILTDQQRHKVDADEQRRAWMEGRMPEP
jgi:hypothetical protein